MCRASCVIKIDPYNFELYRVKAGSFFLDTVCIFFGLILLADRTNATVLRPSVSVCLYSG